MKAVAQRPIGWIDKHVPPLCLPLLIMIMAVCGSNAPPGGANNPPTVNAGADQTVNAGASVTLNGSGSSDPDGNALTFSWKQTLGTSVSLSSTTAAVVTFTAPSNGTTLAFELTVSDGQNSSVATVHVSVRQVEQSAHVDEIAQRAVTEDPAVMGNFPNGWKVD